QEGSRSIDRRRATLSGSPQFLRSPRLAFEYPQPEMPAVLRPSTALGRDPDLIGLEHDGAAGIGNRDVEREIVGQHPIEDGLTARSDDETRSTREILARRFA